MPAPRSPGAGLSFGGRIASNPAGARTAVASRVAVGSSLRTTTAARSARSALGLTAGRATTSGSIASLRSTVFGVSSPVAYAPVGGRVYSPARWSYFYTPHTGLWYNTGFGVVGYQPYWYGGYYNRRHWGWGWNIGVGVGFWWGHGYVGVYSGYASPWYCGWYRPWYSWYPRYYAYPPIVSYVWDPWPYYWDYPYYGTTYVINRNYYYEPAPTTTEEVVYDGYLEAAEERPASVVRPSSGVRVVSSKEPAVPEDTFFDSLKPAEQSVALGVVHFRGGEYEKASESFYNATVDSPDSALPALLVAESLFAIGEYKYAAEYLKKAIDRMPGLPGTEWDPRGLYGDDRKADFEAHLQALRTHLDEEPGDLDAALVAGFFLGASGRHDDAIRTFDAVIAREPGNPYAATLRAASMRRREGAVEVRPREVTPAAEFLRTFRIGSIPRLGL